MANFPNIPSWVDFFEQLKSSPALWKVKPDNFKDRNKKRAAYETLLESYKFIDPTANVDSRKKRLTNLKAVYRRELKKVEARQRSGAGAEDEYIPQLWYFESLDFLRDEETQIPGVSTMDLGDDDVDVAEEATEQLTKPLQIKRKSTSQHVDERNVLLKEVLGQLNENRHKDDASIFADSWATSFRKLPPTQQIYAKKAIEEILVLGQLNLLSLNSVSSPSSTAEQTTPSSLSTSSSPSPSGADSF